MKKAIIDIGSNSVRIAIFADGIVVYRDKVTSQLGEGMIKDNVLKDVAIIRTIDAISNMVIKAIELGVLKSNIFAFATAAVRNSFNGKKFVSTVKSNINIDINVLSGEVEGEIAMLGALMGNDGACIDIGGASSELVIAENKKIVYSHSLKLGAVLIYDLCGNDIKKIKKTVSEGVKVYSNGVKIKKLTAIGGTSSACAFLCANLPSFDRDKTNGRYISKSELANLCDRLFALSEKERIDTLRLGEKRAKIICGGAQLLLGVVEKYKLDGVTVSENDNLEGYYAYLEGKRYAK